MKKRLLPIPLKYLPDRLRAEGHNISLYMPVQCALCKTWYSIPPDDKTEYHYYCAAEACLKEIDDETIRNDERAAALQQIFKNSGMEVSYVPPSYRSLRFSEDESTKDGTSSDKE